RVLKTGFIPSLNEEFPLTNDAIDELENYVLAYGIRSRQQWFSEEQWIFQRFHSFDQSIQTDEERRIQQRINAYRDQVVNIIRPFDEKIRGAQTIKDFCEAIYRFLETI